MCLRHAASILLAAIAIIGGAQFRVAKITIKERSGPRTVFRVCLPGGKPDVFAMTDRDFMCHIYDWYGFRELDGGFGLATENQRQSPNILLPASVEPGTLDEATAIGIAKRCVASNDTWAAQATYQARRDGSNWSVTGWHVPLILGGFRVVTIASDGRVTDYARGG